MKFTVHDIEQLQKQGKIRGYTSPANQAAKFQAPGSGRSTSAAKDWLAWNLPYWCNDHSVTLETEYSFHPARKWRFDYAIPALMIGIEYEGIFSAKSRHTTYQGYNADTDKYNTAAAMGWKVIRLTAKNYTTVLKILNDIIK